MIARGLLRRCPRCGGSGWWTGLLRRVPRCRSCGYRYEREDGFSLGAITMNITATFALLAVVFLVGVTVSYPHLAVFPMLVVGGLVVFVVPIFFYPISYTLWAAIDLSMHPLDPDEISDAQAALATQMISREENA